MRVVIRYKAQSNGLFWLAGWCSPCWSLQLGLRRVFLQSRCLDDWYPSGTSTCISRGQSTNSIKSHAERRSSWFGELWHQHDQQLPFGSYLDSLIVRWDAFWGADSNRLSCICTKCLHALLGQCCVPSVFHHSLWHLCQQQSLPKSLKVVDTLHSTTVEGTFPKDEPSKSDGKYGHLWIATIESNDDASLGLSNVWRAAAAWRWWEVWRKSFSNFYRHMVQPHWNLWRLFSPQPNRRSRWGGQSRSLGSYMIDESDKEEDVEAKEPKFDSKSVDWHKHLSLWKDTSQSWVKFSSCMFKCLARGTMNLLEACGYLAVGTLYSGYADAWAFWAIQILFTVINIMIVDFLLRSFEPSNIKSDWLIWVLRRHPFIVACIVASGPLFCVIAAATSWVVMDRFLIPLCYGTHTLVNIYFVSMFTTDEEVQERHHDSDSENEQEGIEAVQAGWGPWAAQPMPRNSSSKEDFFPVQMLRQGTMVVNFLWSCAFLWALYGAWFGMDFKNSKAAVQSWRDPLPLLDVSGETMASPSPFWKPHALVCPRKQVFVADRYHVYELKNNNTKVERYPCLINGTIADVAAACDEKSCWPVVLLQGVPPLVLDCSTGRQDPLLQTTADAGRIATDADNEHKLQTLVATMGDKMIVQYGWSVQREAWEPLWDIENTVGVLAMDLISDRLLVFHEGGYVQAQDMQTGRLCSTWAFDSKDAVIGGGCGNKKYKTILILVKKGHGTTLMRAELPGLDECTGKANRPAVSLIAWRSEMVPSRFVATLCQVSVKVCGLWLSKGFMKVGPCVRAIQESKKFQRMWMVMFGVWDVVNGQSATCNMFRNLWKYADWKVMELMDVTFCFVFGAVSSIFGYFFPQLIPRRWAPTRWPPVRYPEFPCVLQRGEIMRRYWVWLYSKESQKTIQKDIKQHKTGKIAYICIFSKTFLSLLYGRASWVVFPGGEGCAGSVTRQAGQVAVHFLNSGFSAHGTSLQVCLADHKLQQLVGISRSDHKKFLKKS